MKVQNTNNSPLFRAKLPLNSRELLKNTKLYNQTTPLDAMFNEGAVVEGLNNFTVLIKNKLLYKYFDNPKNSFERFLVQVQSEIIKYCRILASKIFVQRNKFTLKNIENSFNKLDKSSPEYIEEIAKMGAKVDKKFVLVNSEDKVLDELAKSGDAAVFVLNHPNHHKDKFVYTIINSLLNKMYVTNNKQSTCPRPKILVSKNMLKIVDSPIARIYQQFGLTPVDASLGKKDTKYNISPMKKLLSEFIENKSNVFFFPEGKNSAYANKPLEEKVQPGIAQFIKTALALKQNIKVIPVGIQYTKEKNCLGRIYIGQPINFDSVSKTKNKNSILKLICANMKNAMNKTNEIQS